MLRMVAGHGPPVFGEKVGVIAVSNVQRALRTRHPLEIMQIKRVVDKAVIGPLSNSDMERLWETFSHDRKAESGWLLVMDETLKDFENWLAE